MRFKVDLAGSCTFTINSLSSQKSKGLIFTVIRVVFNKLKRAYWMYTKFSEVYYCLSMTCFHVVALSGRWNLILKVLSEIFTHVYTDWSMYKRYLHNSKYKIQKIQPPFSCQLKDVENHVCSNKFICRCSTSKWFKWCKKWLDKSTSKWVT